MKKLIVFLLAFSSIYCQAGPFDDTFYFYGGVGSAPGVYVNRARNNSNLPELITGSDSMFGFYFGGYTGSAFATTSRASLEIKPTETWSTTANGTQFIFKATPVTSIVPTTAFTVTGSSVSINVGLFTLPISTGPRTNVTPTIAGQVIYNSTLPELCMSTGTAINSWVKVSTPTVACAN